MSPSLLFCWPPTPFLLLCLTKLPWSLGVPPLFPCYRQATLFSCPHHPFLSLLPIMVVHSLDSSEVLGVSAWPAVCSDSGLPGEEEKNGERATLLFLCLILLVLASQTHGELLPHHPEREREEGSGSSMKGMLCAHMQTLLFGVISPPPKKKFRFFCKQGQVLQVCRKMSVVCILPWSMDLSIHRFCHIENLVYWITG